MHGQASRRRRTLEAALLSLHSHEPFQALHANDGESRRHDRQWLLETGSPGRATVRQVREYAVYPPERQERLCHCRPARQKQPPHATLIQRREGTARVFCRRNLVQPQDAWTVAARYYLGDSSVGVVNDVRAERQRSHVSDLPARSLKVMFADDIRPANDQRMRSAASHGASTTRASDSSTPVSTSTPAARNRAAPPSPRDVGSSTAINTREISITRACLHAGCARHGYTALGKPRPRPSARPPAAARAALRCQLHLYERESPHLPRHHPGLEPRTQPADSGW